MSQVEVPSIGKPEDDAKTVELKLRQVQKNKGTIKVPPPTAQTCYTLSPEPQRPVKTVSSIAVMGIHAALIARVVLYVFCWHQLQAGNVACKRKQYGRWRPVE